MKKHPIKVTSYSGYRAEEKPVSFVFQGKEHRVKDVISSSCEEDLDGKLRRRFKVRTYEDLVFDIHYDEEAEEWFIGFS